MKLLTVTIDFPPMTGGVARYTELLCRYFREHMTVIADERCKEGKGAPSEVSVRYQPLTRARWPHWWPMVNVIRQTGADLTITHHVLPIGLACLLSGRPYAVVLHGMDFDLATRSTWKRLLTRRILRGAQLLITTTRFLQERVEGFCDVTSLIVPPMPGIMAKNMAPREQTADRVELLSVGRLVARKGYDRVLRVLAAHPTLANKVHYTILGGAGNAQADIEAYIAKEQLDVTVTSNVTDEELRSAYMQADLFVMPSTVTRTDREGFGIVYLEAASFGVPSIASRTRGVDEAVLDERTGLLVDSDEELYQALVRLVEDHELRQQLGTAAQERVRTAFHPDQVFAPLKEHLGL